MNVEFETMPEGFSLEDFVAIHCPKCNAKHIYFKNRELIDCYRCNYEFTPTTAKYHTLDMTPTAYERYQKQESTNVRPTQE